MQNNKRDLMRFLFQVLKLNFSSCTLQLDAIAHKEDFFIFCKISASSPHSPHRLVISQQFLGELLASPFSEMTRFIRLQTQPTKLRLTFVACHMIAASILLNVAFAVDASFGVFLAPFFKQIVRVTIVFLPLLILFA
jgi:hypothetical protein